MKFSIEKYFRDKFKLTKEDFNKLKFLFIFSFFLGLFIAFYFVPANSQFLANFGHKELPIAYIFSGIVGTIAIVIYSNIQIKYKSKTLFTIAILIMLFISLISRFFLVLLDKNLLSLTTYEKKLVYKYLAFFVFIWAWPFIAFVSTVTGGLAVRLLNLLQVKKFYGLINLGGVIAAIISYFTISLLIKILPHHYDLILIGSIGLIAAIILIFYIYKKFPETKSFHNEVKQNFIKSKLLKNKFIIFIFITALLSAVVIFLVDYGFLITIKSQTGLFPNDQAVAAFMSIVFAGLKIGEFLISVFSGRILSRWGIKVGLTFMGITITTIFLLAFISAQIAGTLSFFFLGFITANKMLERIIRRGIDDPSFNVLYQALPDNQKLYIQTRVGIVQQLAIALAGIILFIINLTLVKGGEIFKLGLYPLYILPVMILFILSAFKLYNTYKYRIHQILEEKRLFDFQYVEKDVFALDILQKNILSPEKNTYKFSALVLSETNPRSLEVYASFLLKIDDNLLRKIILLNIDSTYTQKLVKIIEQVGDKIGFKERELQKIIIQALYNLDFSDITNPASDQEIEQLINSSNVKDKIKAIKYFIKFPQPRDIKYIKILLEDDNRQVKLAAIKLASKRKTPQLWEKIIKLLEDSEYNNLVISILVEIGEDILNILNKFFINTQNNIVKEKILQVFAKIGTAKAQRMIISYINYPNRHIQEVVIDALYYSDFKAKEDTIAIIKEKIKDTVDNIMWLYLSIRDIVREKNTLKLVQSLDLERISKFEQLFKLLSFIHETELIELIKTNIIGENTIFALELIDNFIDNDIKHILLPIFEPISIGQKVKRLKPHFHYENLTFKERLLDIIMSDYRRIDNWTISKALELLAKQIDKTQINIQEIPKIQFPETWTREQAQLIYKKLEKCTIRDILIAIYNPDPLVFDTAAKILYKISPQLCEKIFSTIPKNKSHILNKLKNKDDLIIDRIKKLKRIYLFYTVSEKSLQYVAEISKQIKLSEGETLNFFIEGQEYIFLIIKGELKAENKNFSRNTLIIRGLNAPIKTQKLIVEKKANILALNRFKFFNLLATDREIIKHIFSRMKI